MWRYLTEAFKARPIGMIVPPNWIMIAATLLLAIGFREPGILAIGAGLEVGYLLALSTNRRFQRWVDAQSSELNQQQWLMKQRLAVAGLDPVDQRRYNALEQRCRQVLTQQADYATQSTLELQGDGFGKLLWIYLQLLSTRQSLVRALREANSVDEPPDQRMERLAKKMRDRDLTADLRRSYQGQMDILRQRLEKQNEARQKLEYLEAELVRIEQQVELLREQAMVNRDPNLLSQRIDEVGATLGGTSQWIRDQQQLYGPVNDLLEGPPPMRVDRDDRQSVSQ